MKANSKLCNIFYTALIKGSEHYAYPNEIVELAEPVVEQFIRVVCAVWHFVVYRRVLEKKKDCSINIWLADTLWSW